MDVQLHTEAVQREEREHRGVSFNSYRLLMLSGGEASGLKGTAAAASQQQQQAEGGRRGEETGV